MKRVTTLAIILAATQTGCIVAGYSSTGGWFIWPGSIVLALLVLFLVLRGRR